MREAGLRWKGRIGSLKTLGALGGIGACIILLIGVSGLSLILKDTDQFQETTAAQLVNGKMRAPILCVGVTALLVSAVPFLFPSTVFVPYPVDTSAGPAPARATVRATGYFLELKQLEPAIKVGERTRRFSNVVANIIPLAQQRLMIYIHHKAKTEPSSGMVQTTESDWGAFIDRDTVQTIEPGKIYGWTDRWAVRFQHLGSKEKEETLLVIFESAAAQAQFVNLLQTSGFTLAAVPAKD